MIETTAWVVYVLAIFIVMGSLLFNNFFTIVDIAPTGSMEPNLNENSFVVIKKNFVHPISEGSIITYHRDDLGLNVIHRVMGYYLINGEYYYITKGDNLDKYDIPVHYSQVYGVVTVNI